MLREISHQGKALKLFRLFKMDLSMQNWGLKLKCKYKKWNILEVLEIYLVYVGTKNFYCVSSDVLKYLCFISHKMPRFIISSFFGSYDVFFLTHAQKFKGQSWSMSYHRPHQFNIHAITQRLNSITCDKLTDRLPQCTVSYVEGSRIPYVEGSRILSCVQG